MNKRQVMVARKAADIIEGFQDWEHAGDVIHCLSLALGTAISLSANDKDDALGTLDAVFECIKDDTLKNYDRRHDLRADAVKGLLGTRH